MCKTLILAIAVVLPMSVFAQKFGVVDVEAVFQAMPEATTMRTSIEEASQRYQTEFDQLRADMDKLVAEYQNLMQDKTTPETILERRASDIQERSQKIDQFRAQAQQDLNRLQETLAAPIQQKISEAVKTVGVEGEYTFIFPNEQGLLLYQGTNVVDVTNAVKEKLGLK